MLCSLYRGENEKDEVICQEQEQQSALAELVLASIKEFLTLVLCSLTRAGWTAHLQHAAASRSPACAQARSAGCVRAHPRALRGMVLVP